MATTIKSTALDFDNIKNNLKNYLANKDEFADYNFEASGLSNILDVLAHNTHMNALIANFALNESYLPTAQLRSSAVSLAEGIGYIPDTATASVATIRISVSIDDETAPNEISLPAYTKFSTEVDGETYTFQTIESHTATNNGFGFYQFKTDTGSNAIPIYEGTRKTKIFIVGEYEDNPVYVIPDKTIDASTVEVRIYENAPYSNFTTYQNILNATSISAESTIYVLKESPIGYYELSFGDGVAFGINPPTGSKIEVVYLSTVGADANNAVAFEPSAELNVNGIDYTLQVSTANKSVGGDEKESVESIRQKAPFQYATQNRMVTAEDYKSLVLRQKNYSTFISDIAAWGGEDALQPEFGAVNLSILYEDDVTDDTIDTIELGVLSLAEQLAITSFNVRFVKPVITYIEADVFFQLNPKLTDLTISTTESRVTTAVENYFANTIGGFNQSFRRSNMLTLVDEVSNAVLSSRANIRMQQRIVPTAPNLINVIQDIATGTLDDDTLNYILYEVVQRNFKSAASFMTRTNQELTAESYTTVLNRLSDTALSNSQTLRFPVSIAQPDNDTYTITSTSFVYEGKNCLIRNELLSRNLQIVTTDGTLVVDSIGSYDPTAATVTINYFNPTRVFGGTGEVKIAAVPANQSAITPTRNDLLRFDLSRSQVNAVTVSSLN